MIPELQVFKDLLGSFRMIDDLLRDNDHPSSRAKLRALRQRLTGEALGDVQLTLAAVTANFELCTMQSGVMTRTPRSRLEASLQRMAAEPGMLMCVGLDRIVLDGTGLAGIGRIHTVCTSGVAGALTGSELPDDAIYSSTSHMAIFCEFDGDRMAAETLLLVPDEAGFEPLGISTLPSKAELARAIGDSVTAGDGV
jgi:hypothetical protein